MSDTPPADPTPPVDPPAPPPSDPPPPPELGDPGKKALDDERTARKAAEKAAREAQAELEKLRTEQLPDHEKAVAEAANLARTAALAEVNGRLFAALLKAETAGKLADPDLLSDPEVAVRLLGLGEIPVTGNGDIDAEAISTSVASFLEAKPYLAGATPPGTGTPPPDLGQGARGTQTPRQLTRTDLVGMSPEQIDQARTDGLLTDLMAGKS